MRFRNPFMLTALLIFYGGLNCFSEVKELTPDAVSDGEILYSTKGSAELMVIDLEQSAKVGEFYGSLYQAIIEFYLPEITADQLDSAVLSLTTNYGANGVEGALSPVTLEVFGYVDLHADGFVMTNDVNAGESLGKLVLKGQIISKFGKLPLFDVSDFVRKATAEGKTLVGFRVKAVDLVEGDQKKGVALRMSEFGQKFPGNAPLLKLTTH